METSPQDGQQVREDRDFGYYPYVSSASFWSQTIIALFALGFFVATVVNPRWPVELLESAFALYGTIWTDGS